MCFFSKSPPKIEIIPEKQDTSLTLFLCKIYARLNKDGCKPLWAGKIREIYVMQHNSLVLTVV
jgi:hypothetical protein